MATPDGKRCLRRATPTKNAYGAMRSEEIGVRLITFLNNWVMSGKLGHITGSNADFILPSIEEDDSEKRNLRSPDVSFVSA
ncbi:hypothetical protein [Nostoc sp.]|uniref:hypothetical protein n=1 Tax=Nostoc sp. TaxID=1180 RepID=UPI002FF7DCA3